MRAHQVKIAYIHVRFLVQTLVSMSMSKPALCRTISILMAQALHFNLQLHTRENPSLPADIFPRAERLTRTLFSKSQSAPASRMVIVMRFVGACASVCRLSRLARAATMLRVYTSCSAYKHGKIRSQTGRTEGIA